MDRAKRNIIKPSRYQTTSSDEGNIKPREKRKTQENIKDTMAKDINELRESMENSSNNTCNRNHTETQRNIDNIQQLQTSTCTQYFSSPQICNQYTTLQVPTYTTSYANEKGQAVSTVLAPRCDFVPNETNNHGNETYINLDAQYSQSLNNDRSTETLESRSFNYTDDREICGRLDSIEREMRKFSYNLEHILKFMQKKHRRISQKPDCLPISTEAEMMAFETADEETYEEVVNYFQSVGGFTVKEAINLSFKEGMKDNVTMAYTWLGREENSRSLYNTRIILAMYDAACNNQYFSKPTKAEFQVNAREALRSAKQRHRTSTRRPNIREQRAMQARNY